MTNDVHLHAAPQCALARFQRHGWNSISLQNFSGDALRVFVCSLPVGVESSGNTAHLDKVLGLQDCWGPAVVVEPFSKTQVAVPCGGKPVLLRAQRVGYNADGVLVVPPMGTQEVARCVAKPGEQVTALPLGELPATGLPAAAVPGVPV